MERHICILQNMHQSALALQALQTVLHVAGVIYPIMDNKCVAPILLVLKKTGTMLEEIRMMLMRKQGFTKKRLWVFMIEWLREKSFMLETKFSFIICIWNFFLEICALVGLDPLLFLIFFLWCSWNYKFRNKQSAQGQWASLETFLWRLDDRTHLFCGVSWTNLWRMSMPHVEPMT